MTLPRIYTVAKLVLNQKIILEMAASNHILRVLRLKVNDPLIIFNGVGGEFSALLKGINKHQAVVITEEFFPRNNEPPLQIHLGQGISRGEKMDFAIQKSVELGVNTITPIFTEHCNIKLESERREKRLHHWQKVAIGATEQSGRCYVPKVLSAQNLENWLASTSGLCLILDPYATNKLAEINEQPNHVTILIGPEGGLSDAEIDLTKQKNFIPVRLGPRILRTETAALAIISILQAKWGDF